MYVWGLKIAPGIALPTSGPKWAFGKVLREARKAAGISQERVAELTGMDHSFISLVERGIQSPNITALFSIAEKLNVAAAEMIANTESVIQVVPITGKSRSIYFPRALPLAGLTLLHT